MINNKFKELLILIFKNTFEIKPAHNADPVRGGHFSLKFTSNQLEKALKKIDSNLDIYKADEVFRATIRDFFKSEEFPVSERVDKTKNLIYELGRKGYLKGIADIIDDDGNGKCDQNTLSEYETIILNIWDYYYGEYKKSLKNGTSSCKTYVVPRSVIKDIVSKYKTPVLTGPGTCESIPEYIKSIKEHYGPESAMMYIHFIYYSYFKPIVENHSYDYYSEEEKENFIKALYSVSDIIDVNHNKDSYLLNTEILKYYDQRYGVGYKKASVQDLKRIQGCIYAIGIENSENSLIGNIKLVKNTSIRITENQSKITVEEKLDLCMTALNNLLSHAHLNGINSKLEKERYLPSYENKLNTKDVQKIAINSDDIAKLTTIAFIHSNIAACEMNYMKLYSGEIGDAHYENCKEHHMYSRYLRNLMVRICKKVWGVKSKEYETSVATVAAYLNTIARRCYIRELYSQVIVIRSVLYSYYTRPVKIKDDEERKESEKNNLEMAQVQLKNSPFSDFEAKNGNAALYDNVKSNILDEYKTEFSIVLGKYASGKTVSDKDLLTYEEYKAQLP